MRCPVCLDQELVPHVRDGVETDHCSRCKGLWLDRGELDKLLDVVDRRSVERASTRSTPAAPPRDERDRDRDRGDRRREHRDDRRDDRRDERSSKSRKKKKRGAFAELLEDVFDIID